MTEADGDVTDPKILVRNDKKYYTEKIFDVIH